MQDGTAFHVNTISMPDTLSMYVMVVLFHILLSFSIYLLIICHVDTRVYCYDLVDMLVTNHPTSIASHAFRHSAATT